MIRTIRVLGAALGAFVGLGLAAIGTGLFTELMARAVGPEGLHARDHVGESNRMPAMDLPTDPGWSWNKVLKQGDVVAEIIKEANRLPANLIVMVTKGRNGFLDALRGSVTEQVLRQAPCPVLAVPEP